MPQLPNKDGTEKPKVIFVKFARLEDAIKARMKKLVLKVGRNE